MLAAKLRMALLLMLLLATTSSNAHGQELNTYDLIKESKSLKIAGHGEVADALLRSQIRELEAVLKKQPDNDQKRMALVSAHFRLDNHPATLANLDSILSRQPRNAHAHALKAYSLLLLQKFPESEQAYRKAIEIAPKDTSPRLVYASGLLSVGRRNEAEKITSELFELDPHGPSPYMLLAAIAFTGGKYSEWEQMQRTAIVLSPRDKADELREDLSNVLSHAQKSFDAAYQTRLNIAKHFDIVANELELLYLAKRVTKPVDPQPHIDRIYALHRAGKYPDESFVRDWIVLGDQWIVVNEYFDLENPYRCKYTFQLASTGGKDKEFQILVASYPETTETMRKEGTLAKTETAFSLIVVRGAKTECYGVFCESVTYEQIREVVAEIFAGKRQPQAAKLIEPTTKDR